MMSVFMKSVDMTLDQFASDDLWHEQLPFYVEIAPFLTPNSVRRGELVKLSKHLQNSLTEVSGGIAFYNIPPPSSQVVASHHKSVFKDRSLTGVRRTVKGRSLTGVFKVCERNKLGVELANLSANLALYTAPLTDLINERQSSPEQ